MVEDNDKQLVLWKVLNQVNLDTCLLHSTSTPNREFLNSKVGFTIFGASDSDDHFGFDRLMLIIHITNHNITAAIAGAVCFPYFWWISVSVVVDRKNPRGNTAWTPTAGDATQHKSGIWV